AGLGCGRGWHTSVEPSHARLGLSREKLPTMGRHYGKLPTMGRHYGKLPTMGRHYGKQPTMGRLIRGAGYAFGLESNEGWRVLELVKAGGWRSVEHTSGLQSRE